MDKTKAVVVFLVVVLTFQSFSAPAQTPEEKIAKIKEQLAVIPVGSTIEVKLLQPKVIYTEPRLPPAKYQKFAGKLLLVSVADESFLIKCDNWADCGSFEKRIAFADVESVRKRGSAKKVLIIVGGIAVFAALLAAHHFSGGQFPSN